MFYRKICNQILCFFVFVGGASQFVTLEAASASSQSLLLRTESDNCTEIIPEYSFSCIGSHTNSDLSVGPTIYVNCEQDINNVILLTHDSVEVNHTHRTVTFGSPDLSFTVPGLAISNTKSLILSNQLSRDDQSEIYRLIGSFALPLNQITYSVDNGVTSGSFQITDSDAALVGGIIRNCG